ncbi:MULTISPECIES: social motility TPR repeat lipoprotein Tgl [Myxococcus]|uniref:Social gliding motility protein Tgl n=1 Tax=Myxococcus xanthus TaxID=34 RepID=A0AAE6KSC5_MYXXA|nr:MULTISPECIES: social motility TPR repeat lipoprotein Tgl [Myxococcus]QDE68168.1 social gliding motility protein Tgl [Myxococcus xanthus]QDE75445.1 social gliding motility protein Tgl [Myxococcus xanthus]QDE97019.1 social gliding motility protein Tgl [Myxococcus xanthus]QDF04562.1 social gliding motility protein Tgl [Myxococcus xanthus]WAM29488.1 social motility TPR repeat lipoprotein Tgl [Myxococcus sp. NMCA1]
MFRLSTASCSLALLLVSSGCSHTPTEKEKRSAEIHYDLALQAQQAGELQEALRELQLSLKNDPDYPDANNAMGILLHLAFRRPDEAVKHYTKALEVRPDFSEARTNLANVHLDQGRYDDAIKLYELVLNDMLYPTPFIAQGNLGWAYYKKGEPERAVESIKAAVTTNPNFCLGYKNLGLIYDETGRTSEACRQFTHYRENCPDVAEAYMREGVCQAKLGQVDAAKAAFATCETKAKAGEQVLKDDCRRLLEKL